MESFFFFGQYVPMTMIMEVGTSFIIAFIKECGLKHPPKKLKLLSKAAVMVGSRNQQVIYLVVRNFILLVKSFKNYVTKVKKFV